jgi:hypothetical protein
MNRYGPVFLLLLASAAPLTAENVVVWDFATRDGGQNEVTRSLTSEFEEALAQKGTYKILERRNIPRLQTVIDNEKALRDIGQISATGTLALKKLGATVVVFGEMFDDIDSGEISITTTFQDFQGSKTLIKSVLMKRGLVHDATSRRQTVAALVDAISGVVAPTGKAAGKSFRVEQNDFIFDLESCELSVRTVLCRFSIANNGEDRKLFIILNAKHGGWADKKYIEPMTRTVMYDDFNNEATPVRIQLSNSSMESGDRPVIGAMLISGRPAEATIRFEGIASKATTIARLDITCVDGESGDVFVAAFRNIQLSTKK